LDARLKVRESEGLLRTLRTENNLIDFCSNDYLGFSKSFESGDDILINGGGSTGSRLLTGNSGLVEKLEGFIAEYHKSEAGLIFNSGYDANLGLLSAIPQRGDTVLYDELIHASVRDGIRLGFARSQSFKHNSLKDLERKIQKIKGIVYIVVESVYSMDGDFAPLQELTDIIAKYRSRLIVDEAHATGVFGNRGEGRVVQLNLESKVFARVHTFGKALGAHGAIVLGSEELRQLLINFARPFIYSTALPKHGIYAIKTAYDKMSKSNYKILELNGLIDLYRKKIEGIKTLYISNSFSPIQCLVLGGNERVKRISSLLQNEGFDVRPILSPTVQLGTERLRICLHIFNTSKDVERLVNSIIKLL